MEEQESPKEDVTVSQDIDKRFQHLVNEWSSFQKRAGLSGPRKEISVVNLVEQAENLSKEIMNDSTESPSGGILSTQLRNSILDDNVQDLDESAENSWTDLCKMLSDVKFLPEHLKEQGKEDNLLQHREEQLRNTEKRLTGERNKISDAQRSLLKYEETLSMREKMLRKQEQVVAESQKAIDASLLELQKRSAEIVIEDSLILEKKQHLETFESQLDRAMHELQSQTEALNKKRLEIHEQDIQVRARERVIESQRILFEEEKANLRAEWTKLEEEKVIQDKEREKNKEKEETIVAREKEIEGNSLALESLSRKLNAREKLLKNMKRQGEEERVHIADLMEKVEAENKAIAEAKKELEISKKSLDEAWERVSSERQEAAEYIKSADERIKVAEERLRQQEQDLLQRQEVLGKLEIQVKNEQQQNHVLHSRIQKEQEKMMEEVTIREENLHKRELIVEKKEEDVKKNLQKLAEKKSLVDLKLKQLKEIETRTESLEEELHRRHQEHLQKVERHAKQYEAQVEQLETMKHDLQQKSSDVEIRFQEVQALKREAKHWQKKVEKEFNDKMDVFLKDKEELENQKKHLIGLQREVEKAGTKLIDQMMAIEEASTKIDMLREKLEVSQRKLQILVNHISQQQKFLKEKEKSLIVKERQMEGFSKEWERKNAQLIAREEILNLQEQALRSREENFNELESNLKERKEQKHDYSINLHHVTNEDMLADSRKDSSSKLLDREIVRQNGTLTTEVHPKRKESTKTEQSADTLTLEMLQQEFKRIMKERESLKAQQLELEQTKTEVQDAKLTLAAQLRATKEMVVDASITAQKASREREALEQERKRLGKTQKEIEAVLVAREAKITLEEKKIENEKHLLEEEKQHAMNIIYKAEQMKKLADTVEKNGNGASNGERPGLGKAMHRRNNSHSTSEPFLKARQNPSTAAQQPNAPLGVEIISMWREKECAKIQREEKIIMEEISRLHHKRQDDKKTPAGIKDLADDLRFTGFPESTAGNDRYQLYHRNLGPSLEALELHPCQDSGELSNGIYCLVSDEQMDGSFSGSENTCSGDTMQQDEEGTDVTYEDVSSNRCRLESVMKSLLNAREASKSRLQRTKGLLQTLPPGGYITLEILQALDALTDRLRMMEQKEDELTDELKEAYKAELPDSEGIIVDKVELLCRMEEQQALRAEWEDDIQCQLDKIRMLQGTNSQSSSCFSTPVKHTVFDHIVSPPSAN